MNHAEAKSALARAELGSVYQFGDEFVGLSSTCSDVFAILGKILRPPLCEYLDSPSTNVAARLCEDGWHLEVDGLTVERLAHRTPIPRVAEEIIAAACSAVAKKTGTIVINGAILEKDGAAVALVGDDLDSAKVIGFHLHARGWVAVTFGYAFVHATTLDAVGLRALASVSSSSIDQIPRKYRAAIEASLWYYSGFDLIFYMVDSSIHQSRSAPVAKLTHVVIVDGAQEDLPSITTNVDPNAIGALANHRLLDALHISRLTLGAPIASCDAVRRWVFGPTL